MQALAALCLQPQVRWARPVLAPLPLPSRPQPSVRVVAEAVRETLEGVAARQAAVWWVAAAAAAAVAMCCAPGRPLAPSPLPQPACRSGWAAMLAAVGLEGWASHGKDVGRGYCPTLHGGACTPPHHRRSPRSRQAPAAQGALAEPAARERPESQRLEALCVACTALLPEMLQCSAVFVRCTGDCRRLIAD